MKKLMVMLAVAAGLGAAPARSNEVAEDVLRVVRTAQPNDHHRKLERLAGSWVATFKDPHSGKESRGTSENALVLGGRWLKQDVQGTCPVFGTAFRGTGHYGYDNLKQAYVGTCVDDISTSVTTLEGTLDATGNVFTFVPRSTDASGKEAPRGKWVLTIKDADHHVLEVFVSDVRVMEIRYERAKP